jgi:hypothetical protein
MEDTPTDVQDKLVAAERLEHVVLPVAIIVFVVGSNPHSTIDKNTTTRTRH